MKITKANSKIFKYLIIKKIFNMLFTSFLKIKNNNIKKKH